MCIRDSLIIGSFTNVDGRFTLRIQCPNVHSLALYTEETDDLIVLPQRSQVQYCVAAVVHDIDDGLGLYQKLYAFDAALSING